MDQRSDVGSPSVSTIWSRATAMGFTIAPPKTTPVVSETHAAIASGVRSITTKRPSGSSGRLTDSFWNTNEFECALDSAQPEFPLVPSPTGLRQKRFRLGVF